MLRSDVERKRLAGLNATAHSESGIGQGLYTNESSQNTYKHLSRITEELLKTGWPVIVDATFLERWQRDLFREIAKRYDVQFKILDVEAEQATLHKRLSLRAIENKDASEANIQVLRHQIENYQPLGADELSEVAEL